MAIRYVVQSGGLSSGDCTTLGTAGTLAYVLGSTSSPIVAGDEVRLCAGAGGAAYEITTSTQVLCQFATGTASAPITITGANSSGVVDGTMPEIRATGSWTTNITMFVIGSDGGGNPIQYVRWKLIDFNGNCTGAGTGSYFCFNNSGVLDATLGTVRTRLYHTWEDCVIRNARHGGCSLFSGAAGSEVQDAHKFIRCWFLGNGLVVTGQGANGRGTTPLPVVFDRCLFEGNDRGVVVSAAATSHYTKFNACTFKNNVTGGIQYGNGAGFVAENCTFVGHSGDGDYGVMMDSAQGSTYRISRCEFAGNNIAIVDNGYDFTYDPPYERCAMKDNTSELATAEDFFLLPGQGHTRTRHCVTSYGREVRL